MGDGIRSGILSQMIDIYCKTDDAKAISHNLPCDLKKINGNKRVIPISAVILLPI